MSLRAIITICIGLLTSCSKPVEVWWVPKDGMALVTLKNGKTLCSSADVRRARYFVDADGRNGTIWLEVPTETFLRYWRLDDGELITIQMKGVTVATFQSRELAGSGTPAIPVRMKRNPDGSWLSGTILNRMDERPKP